MGQCGSIFALTALLGHRRMCHRRAIAPQEISPLATSLCALLLSEPHREWIVRDIARALDAESDAVQSMLDGAVADDWISRRVRRSSSNQSPDARYRLTPLGRQRASDLLLMAGEYVQSPAPALPREAYATGPASTPARTTTLSAPHPVIDPFASSDARPRPQRVRPRFWRAFDRARRGL